MSVCKPGLHASTLYDGQVGELSLSRLTQEIGDNERLAVYGVWVVEPMTLDGQLVPMSDATREHDFDIHRGTQAWAREVSGRRHTFDFAWDDAAGSARVQERSSATCEGSTIWTAERGDRSLNGAHLIQPPAAG